MIIKLPPEQISVVWDMIKFSVSEAARSDVLLNGNALNNVLKNLLTGHSQCWMVYENAEVGKNILAVVITYINTDNMTERKNLVVYSLYGFKKASNEIWKDSFEKLKEFGRSNGCDSMIGYTCSDVLRERVEFLGMQETFKVLRVML